MWWSAGAGLVPVPLFELAAITAVEVKLIKELSDVYGVPFRNDLAKAAVVALVGSLGTVALGKMVGYSALRFIPVIGVPLAMTSVSAVAAAVTYAVGKVFIPHFEMGGSLLDFDAAKVRAHFRKEFGNGLSEATAAAVNATGKPSAAV
jgi:uncharacterized protein (DUF697 family)